MFTGIVQETGEVVKKKRSGGDTSLQIRCKAVGRKLQPGQSINVDGVCLTITEKVASRNNGQSFWVDVTPETLRRTNLGKREPGDRVNLEPAAKLSDFLGGHLVQGHVDDTGTISSITEEGNSKVFRIKAAAPTLRYCALKGSITVNGVSLTISGLNSGFFEVTIIPHTLEVTNFGLLKVGDHVNLEADIISKYVESHVRRFLIFAGAALVVCSSLIYANSFGLGPNTVLVYQNRAGEQESQFVLRLARYHPDVFLEWESVNHQGTLHLFHKAVKEGKKFSFSQLFEIGVDTESKDVMTIWLSERMFRELTEKGKAGIEFNHLPLKMELEGEDTFQLTVDKQVREIPVIRVRDDRKGFWTFHKNPNNPILVEYVSPHYRQYLKSISTASKNSLRWIKKLPPVK